MLKPQVLTGHDTEETAFVVGDYPAGYQKRCQIRYWVETGSKGQRVCTQTSNLEKPGQWNAVKRSTYTDIKVLYIDPNTKHVKDASLGRHATKKEVDAFLETYGVENFAGEYHSKTLELMKTYRSLMMQRFASDSSVVQVNGEKVFSPDAPVTIVQSDQGSIITE